MNTNSLREIDENIKMVFFVSVIDQIVLILSSFKKSKFTFLLNDFKETIEANKNLIYYQILRILKGRILFEKDEEINQSLLKICSHLNFFLETLNTLEEIIKNDKELRIFGSQVDNLINYLEGEGIILRNIIRGMIEMGYFYFQLN